MKGIIATTRVWIFVAIALGFGLRLRANKKENPQNPKRKDQKTDLSITFFHLQLKTVVGKTAGSGFV